MRETTLGLTGEPDSAGGALHRYNKTWEPVSAGSLTMYDREARQSGRPSAEIPGKIHEGRAMPKAVLYRTGTPGYAGGLIRRFA